MNLMLKAGEMECRGPQAEDGTRHPSCRAFMDDATVMSSSTAGTGWILCALEKMANLRIWGKEEDTSSKQCGAAITP